MEKNYRISFKIGQISFEAESSDARWVERKEKEYFRKLVGREPKGGIKPEPPPLKIQSGAVPPKVNLTEFYRKYVQKVKRRPDIAVFFVYYLQSVKKKDNVRSSDVLHCFRDIGYPNWNKLNVTDILRRGKRRALLNCVNRLWSLTTTGEDYVLNTISGKAR